MASAILRSTIWSTTSTLPILHDPTTLSTDCRQCLTRGRIDLPQRGIGIAYTRARDRALEPLPAGTSSLTYYVHSTITPSNSRISHPHLSDVWRLQVIPQLFVHAKRRGPWVRELPWRTAARQGESVTTNARLTP
jgi:hypothetical protein